VAFSGPIDVSTVNSNTVFLIKLGDPTAQDEPGGRTVGINQTGWGGAAKKVPLRCGELLGQPTPDARIVPPGGHGACGQRISRSEGFDRFRRGLSSGQALDPALKEYRKEMIDALEAAGEAGIEPKNVATASVFTTMSATAVLEKIRDQIHAATPAPADFQLA